MEGAAREPSGRTGLLLALGLDNLGSGLFLPLSLVFTTTVVGVPLALAGALLTAGTLAGLTAPLVAGRLVDRVGPRAVVVAAQLLQALGTLAYLLARGPCGVVVAAALVAAGAQSFYSALFALVADVGTPGPTDRAFAVVDAVRSAAFGAGALAGAVVLSRGTAGALRVGVAVDGASFVVAAALLLTTVRPRPHAGPRPDDPEPAGPPPPRGGVVGPGTTPGRPRSRARPARPVPVWRDRPYCGLVVVAALLALGTDFFLVGLPVYAVDVVDAPRWVPGVALALLTLVVATTTTRVLARTRTWSRTGAVAGGACCVVAWAAGCAAAARAPAGEVGWWLLGATALLAAASVLGGPRLNALAEAAAPPASRGRHLAAFQCAFTAAGLVAPLLVSAFTVATWLPWAVVAASAATGALALTALARHLPAGAVRPAP